MKGYIQFHKIVALMLGGWFFLLVISGLLLLFKSDVFVLYVSLMLNTDTAVSSAPMGQIYETLRDSCGSLRIDRHDSLVSGLPVFGVICDGAGYLSTNTGVMAPFSSVVMSIYDWVFTFHLDLLLPSGRYLQAIAGAFLLSMSVTGFIIWSKLPGSFWKKATFKAKTRRPGLYFQAHRAIGVWVAILATPVVFFGVVLAAKSLVPLDLNKDAAKQVVVSCSRGVGCLKWFYETYTSHTLFSIRQTVMPSANRLVLLSYPKAVIQGPKDVSTIYLEHVGGASTIKITPKERTAWGVFVSWMYPLHTGKAFPFLGKLYVFIISVGYLALMYYGYAFWYAKRQRKK